jgi:hypothetical protein
MKTTFITTVVKDSEFNATGLQIPVEAIAALNAGKKPKVVVSLNGFTYRTTVAVMGGEFWVPLSQERRQAAGIVGGETLEVTLELDTEPRLVEVPEDLAAALALEPGAAAAFDALSYSTRKEYARQVETARAAETRSRRIAGILEKLRAA